MKKIIIPIVTALLFSSCVKITKIGQLNMVSNRNIDSNKEYVMLQKNAELSKKEKKKAKAEDMTEAIDNLVKKDPNGEYLMNARIYLVYHTYIFFGRYNYVAEGDIYGSKTK